MAVELKSQEQEFVRRMAEEGPELKRRGFEILQGRENPERYFDALIEKGLFKPQEDPKAEKAGRGWRFENWAATGYLKAVAKRVAGDYPRLKEVGQKVVEIVRAVGAVNVAPDDPPRNFFTQMSMVEILTALPQELSTPDDAAMVGGWVAGAGGIASDVCDWLEVILNGQNQEEKALWLLGALTRSTDEERDSEGSVYWIKELLTKRGGDLGRRLRRPALDLIKTRLVELLDERDDALASLFSRPAIEDHAQNAYRPEFEGAMVVALRDGLLGWIDTGAEDAKEYVRGLLSDRAAILRRIALHTIDERFDVLRRFLEERLEPALFAVAHRHELHRLLTHHFAKLAADKRARVLEIVGSLEVSDGENKNIYSRYERARWLSACVGRGVPEAEQLMKETLTADPAIDVPEHPDFDTYSESWSGSGPSPHSLQEVLSWNGDELLEKLRAFVETDHWRGPTRRSLSDTFAEAIRQRPTQFIPFTESLRQLPWTYRYSVLAAFTDLMQKENESTSTAPPWWTDAWEMLITLTEAWVADAGLIRSDEGDDEVVTPNQDWIPAAVARLVEEGSKKDDKGIPSALVGRARAILNRLLEVLPPEERTGWTDALSFAINSARGKVIEALIRMTLKEARAEDKAGGAHASAWGRLEPIVESELRGARDAKYEFSALAGIYFPQLHYLSPQWVGGHIRQLIPLGEHRRNADAFLKGLSYIQLHRALYQLLNNSGLVTELLEALPADNQSRERFLHGIALAYLWGDEQLDGAHLRTLMSAGRESDLADFLDLFRRVQTQLDDPQKTRVRTLVLQVQRAQGDCKGKPPRLLAVLIGLTSYLDRLTDDDISFLSNALPSIESGHYNTFLLNAELNRLLDSNPRGVAAVAHQVLKREHFHDYKDEFKKLISTLHAKGFVPEAVGLLNELRWNPDFRKLAAELERGK